MASSKGACANHIHTRCSSHSQSLPVTRSSGRYSGAAHRSRGYSRLKDGEVQRLQYFAEKLSGYSRLKDGVEARVRRTEDLPRMTSCHVSDPEGEVPGMRVTILVGERGRHAMRNRGQVEQHARQRHVANMAATIDSTASTWLAASAPGGCFCGVQLGIRAQAATKIRAWCPPTALHCSALHCTVTRPDRRHTDCLAGDTDATHSTVPLRQAGREGDSMRYWKQHAVQ